MHDTGVWRSDWRCYITPSFPQLLLALINEEVKYFFISKITGLCYLHNYPELGYILFGGPFSTALYGINQLIRIMQGTIA